MDILLGQLGVDLIRLLQRIGATTDGLLDRFFLTVTFLGDELFYLLLFSLLFWCGSKRLAIQLGLVFGVSNYINELIKGIFGWPRPFMWARQQSPPLDIRLIGAEPSGYSFPSAHSQATGTTWGLITGLTRNKILVTISIGLCILVPLSRLYLGVHWPSDILVGLTIGLTIAILYVIRRKPIVQYFTRYQNQIRVLVAVGVLVPAGLVVVSIFLTTLAGHEPLVQNPGRVGGFLSGITIGLLLEQRFVCFTIEDISNHTRALRSIIGLIVLMGAYVGLKAVFDLDTGTILDILLLYIRYMLLAIVATALIPWVFDLLEQKLGWKPTTMKASV